MRFRSINLKPMLSLAVNSTIIVLVVIGLSTISYGVYFITSFDSFNYNPVVDTVTQESAFFASNKEPEKAVSSSAYSIQSAGDSPFDQFNSNSKSKINQQLSETDINSEKDNPTVSFSENASVSKQIGLFKSDVIRSQTKREKVNTPIADFKGLVPDSGTDVVYDGRIGNQNIHGQVVDARKNPVTNVVVQLSPIKQSNKTISRQVISKSDGEFSFINLAKGEYRIAVLADGQQSGVRATIKTGVNNIELQVRLINQVTIYGKVTDRLNQPLSGALVAIDKGTPNEVLTIANSNGEYSLNHPLQLNSNHRILFSATGFIEYNEIVKINSSSIAKDGVLETDSGLKLTGVVIDEDGDPIEKAVIWLNSGSAAIERRMVTTKSGQFELESLLPASDYQFSIGKNGYKKVYQNQFSINDSIGAQHVVLAKVDTGTVEGVIQDETGNTLVGYSMRIDTMGVEGGRKTITSDKNGKFNATGIYAGSLRFQSKAKPVTHISGATLAAGDNLLVQLVVDTGSYSVSGQIVDDQWQGINGAKVSLSWSYSEGDLNSRSNWSTKTNEDGMFEIAPIGPGKRSVNVQVEGYKNTKAVVEPELMSETTIQLEQM